MVVGRWRESASVRFIDASAKSPVWRPGYPLTSFLYCHLLVYPVSGDISPFPFETSPEAEAEA